MSEVPIKATPTATGRAAESLAANFLAQHGYEVLVRNWRNRWCEIDIVARQAGVVHIVEVKYRRSTLYGQAAEYISHDKAARLRRAALAWTQANYYTGPLQLDIITIEGSLEAPRLELLANAITG